MRVTLAGTAITSYPWGNYNLAIGSLAAYALRRAPGAELSLVQLPITLERPIVGSGAVEAVLEGDPELVGLSGYGWDLDSYRRLIGELKAASPSTIVVLGGPLGTLYGGQLLLEEPGLDAVVRGEGEGPLAAMIASGGRGLGAIPGVLTRDAGPGGVPLAPRVDIDELPSPYLEGVLAPSGRDLLLEWSRGCRYRCRYCNWGSGGGGPRDKGLDLVEGEVRWALERGYSEGVIIDAALNFDGRRLEGLGEVLGGLGGGLSFTYEVHPAHFDEGQLSSLAKIPSLEVCLALESLEEETLRVAGRAPLSKKRFLEIAEALSGVVDVAALIVLGLPGDSPDGFRRTLDFLLSDGRRFLRRVYPSWMVVSPGSYFHRHRARFGLELASPGVPYVLGSRSFPRAEMARAIRALHEGPDRPRVVWLDAPARRYFPELSDLSSEGEASPEGEALIRAIPRDLELPGGWTVDEVSPERGWPRVELRSGEGRLSLRLELSGGRPRLQLLGREGEGGLSGQERAAVRALLRRLPWKRSGR